MSIDLSQFIPSFLEECFEGLALMESNLLDLEQADDETINAIFRAAHSIKGGAGTFGFDHVSDFTHLVETLLDEIRDGRRNITADDVELLLMSVDCMRLLVEAIRDGQLCEDEKILVTANRLKLSLEYKLSEPVKNQPNSDELATTNKDERDIKGGHWHILFIPEHHLVQTGNDPLLLFNALAELGEMSIVAQTNALPALEEIDAEEIYLSWQIDLITNASEADIREVFEWVEDECELIITQVCAEINTNKSEDGPIASHHENKHFHIPSQVVSPPAATTSSSLPSSHKTDSVITEQVKVSKVKQDAGSIRVAVDKIDELINLVGELVITQSMLTELGSNFTLDKIDRLNAGLEQLLQNSKGLQESVLQIRMLPISFAFSRFPRLVHDLANKTGKTIELLLKGEQTELDKTVMEQIGDPLMHLVRNAVDHGIEPVAVRLAKGKTAHGTIVLNAYHQGGSIIIEISDDGGGIDREAVLQKAVEKGIIESGTLLTDRQVYDLIFEPGFSTALQVSDISGRGVGMDVVKKNIQSLGGRIHVESTQQFGSLFKISLPLTLAILDGQLVTVANETYIIPLITIVESLEIKMSKVHRASGDLMLYRLRDENIPIIPTANLFSLSINMPRSLDESLLVIVEADSQKIGLLVDELMAQQQVVIKSLQSNYKQVDGISGATILGDGSVALILDVSGIIRMAQSDAAQSQQKFSVDKFSAEASF